MRASGDRGCGRPRVASGPREVGHAVGGERGKRREGKRGGGIRGGRSRRVALDGKEMGRELNSGVGLFRRNSRARVQGLRGVELNGKENSFSARFELMSFRDFTPGCPKGLLLILTKVEGFFTQGSDARNREECETEPVPQFLPFSIYLSYVMGVPLFRFLSKGERK